MRAKRLPKELVLDCSIWICGSPTCENEPTSLGKGGTKLLNTYGYMCCLGQFGKQAGIKYEDLYNHLDYTEANVKLGFMTEMCFSSDFAERAININDDTRTSIKQKILALKKHFAKIGRKIKVVNYTKATGKKWNQDGVDNLE